MPEIQGHGHRCVAGARFLERDAAQLHRARGAGFFSSSGSSNGARGSAAFGLPARRALTNLSCGTCSSGALFFDAANWRPMPISTNTIGSSIFAAECRVWVVAFLGVDFLYYWWHRLEPRGEPPVGGARRAPLRARTTTSPSRCGSRCRRADRVALLPAARVRRRAAAGASRSSRFRRSTSSGSTPSSSASSAGSSIFNSPFAPPRPPRDQPAVPRQELRRRR